LCSVKVLLCSLSATLKSSGFFSTFTDTRSKITLDAVVSISEGKSSFEELILPLQTLTEKTKQNLNFTVYTLGRGVINLKITSTNLLALKNSER
jgi:hypothetical protein